MNISSSLDRFAPQAAQFVVARLASNPFATPDEPAGEGAMLARVLDGLDYGVLLVAPGGRLRFANRRALRACAGSGCITLADGRVQARGIGGQRTLMNAVGIALQGRRSMITLRSDGAVLPIAVVPADNPADPACEPTALLLLARQQACEPLSVEFFAKEHHITGAEAAVLRCLCNGMAPGGIAAHLGVALSTVRTHISKLRHKTSSRTACDLVRMVTLLPPIVTALS